MKAVLIAMTGAVIATLALSALPAQAQSGKAAQKLEDRFAAADTDHDGKLTKAEAQKTGSVTLDQVKQYMATQMKDRKK